MRDKAYILIEHETGIVSRMQFATHVDHGKLDDKAAHLHGFVLHEDGWHREPLKEWIDKEVARTGFPDTHGAVKSWRLVDKATFDASPRFTGPAIKDEWREWVTQELKRLA